MIHPFTVRADALPPYAENTEQLFDAIYIQAGAEGLFTDFPDKGIQFLQNINCISDHYSVAKQNNGHNSARFLYISSLTQDAIGC